MTDANHLTFVVPAPKWAEFSHCSLLASDYSLETVCVGHLYEHCTCLSWVPLLMDRLQILAFLFKTCFFGLRYRKVPISHLNYEAFCRHHLLEFTGADAITLFFWLLSNKRRYLHLSLTQIGLRFHG